MVKGIVLCLGLVLSVMCYGQEKPGKPEWPPRNHLKGPPPPPTPIDGVSWLLVLAGAGIGAYVYRGNEKKEKIIE